MGPRPPFRSAGLLLLGLLVAAPAQAVTYTYGDTLTTIDLPLPNLPAFARPGDAVRVWATAGAGVGGWGASLSFGSLAVPLAPAGGGYQADKGRWELDFTVPTGTPEEVYDLVVTSDGTLPDTARHAVKVIPAYRTTYYFAQISDTHLPEHTFSSNGSINTADTTGMADFDAVIDDLNLIHPEFVLHTGDLVNEGELEEYLGMYEMGRAQGMISRLFAPMFLASGNHDIGGWQPTAPPAGTSRKDWWRYFGWPWLANPPAADPWHSQDYSFDYGLLHVVGMEAYENYPSYDYYLPATYGQQSMTAEQMGWLAADVAQPQLAGHTKLAFFHYDFGGTNPNGTKAANFTQFNNLPALGLDGIIWGHNHGVAEGNRTAKPFNLGLQSVIDRRAFRIFRVDNGVITPGPMHRSGGTATAPVDSLAIAWSGPDDGTQGRLTATVTNRFGEAWEHAQLRFVLPDHDSSFTVTGGTLAQTMRQGGRAYLHVDCTLPAGATTVVSVVPDAPLSPVAVAAGPPSGFRLEAPTPSPFRPEDGPLAVRYALAREGRVRISVVDPQGRRVAVLFEGTQSSGPHGVTWTGRGDAGMPRAGIYLVRLQVEQGESTRKFALVP